MAAVADAESHLARAQEDAARASSMGNWKFFSPIGKRRGARVEVDVELSHPHSAVHVDPSGRVCMRLSAGMGAGMGGTAAGRPVCPVQACAFVHRWVMGEPGAAIALWVGDFNAAMVRQLESAAADAKAAAENAAAAFAGSERAVKQALDSRPDAPVHDRRRRALEEAAYAAACKATSAGAAAKQARTAVRAYATAAVVYVRRSARAGRRARVHLEVVINPSTKAVEVHARYRAVDAAAPAPARMNEARATWHVKPAPGCRIAFIDHDQWIEGGRFMRKGEAEEEGDAEEGEEVEGEEEVEGDAEEEGEEASDEDDDRAMGFAVWFFWLVRTHHQQAAFRRLKRNARKELLERKKMEEKKTVATVPQASRAAELHASDKGYKLIVPKRWWPE